MCEFGSLHVSLLGMLVTVDALAGPLMLTDLGRHVGVAAPSDRRRHWDGSGCTVGWLSVTPDPTRVVGGGE